MGLLKKDEEYIISLLEQGRKYNIPIIQILDRKKNIFVEMDIKTSDYILLKKYFKKYEVLIDDEFNKI